MHSIMVFARLLWPTSSLGLCMENWKLSLYPVLGAECSVCVSRESVCPLAHPKEGFRDTTNLIGPLAHVMWQNQGTSLQYTQTLWCKKNTLSAPVPVLFLCLGPGPWGCVLPREHVSMGTPCLSCWWYLFPVFDCRLPLQTRLPSMPLMWWAQLAQSRP